MIDALDTVVTFLEGRTVRAVACTEDDSLRLRADILSTGDLLDVQTFDDPAEAASVADDLEGSEYVGATRSTILQLVSRALSVDVNDIRDSGREAPDDDSDGDVLVPA